MREELQAVAINLKITWELGFRRGCNFSWILKR
ncbi:hypothetical protein LINPERHAP2_LOCUS37009 [Linum perenne]